MIQLKNPEITDGWVFDKSNFTYEALINGKVKFAIPEEVLWDEKDRFSKETESHVRLRKAVRMALHEHYIANPTLMSEAQYNMLLDMLPEDITVETP